MGRDLAPLADAQRDRTARLFGGVRHESVRIVHGVLQQLHLFANQLALEEISAGRSQVNYEFWNV